MTRRRLPRAAAVLLTTAAMVGLGGVGVAVGTSAGAEAPPRAPAPGLAPRSSTTARRGADTITISNFMYHPMKLTVAPGATITVTNKDSVTHTLTAAQGQFNTGNIAPGRTKRFRAPTKKGTYHYICAIHQFMMGTIVVK